GPIRAAVHRFALGLPDLGAAERAVLRHLERLRAAAVRPRRPDDLGNHVACALDDDVVALANVLAVDVLLVVERCARDGHASDLHALEHRPRVERPGPPDPDQDLVQPRGRGQRRPLERARPAGPLVQRAEPAAAFRGFGAVFVPSAASRSLKALKPESGMYTSPRTSSTGGGASPSTARSASGIDLIVFRLGVTSSPWKPSPRVAPRTKAP